IHVRAEYILLLMVYTCLNNLTPKYLSDLLTLDINLYCTRSSTGLNLHIPTTKYKTFADRSFSVAGPQLWNKLPEQLK
ncbi:hypothetical protein LOTGIDRAFT_79942, partial [Lottia gigantea]